MVWDRQCLEAELQKLGQQKGEIEEQPPPPLESGSHRNLLFLHVCLEDSERKDHRLNELMNE